MGQGAGPSGTSSGSMSSCRTTRSCATASSCATRSSSTTSSIPSNYKQTDRKPALLDPALGRPDELPLLERAVPGGSDRRTACWPGSSSTRRRGLQDGRFPQGRRRSSRKGSTSGRRVMNEFPGYRDDDLNKKDTGPDRQAICAGAQAARQPGARRLAVQGATWRSLENDTTVDPFDAIEMIGVVASRRQAPTSGVLRRSVPDARGGAGESDPSAGIVLYERPTSKPRDRQTAGSGAFQFDTGTIARDDQLISRRPTRRAAA